VAQLTALKECTARDAAKMVDCQRALDRGREAAKESDPTTHQLLSQVYSEERVSAAWYRHTYGELTGRHPISNALPVPAPDHVVRRADSARPSTAAVAAGAARGPAGTARGSPAARAG